MNLASPFCEEIAETTGLRDRPVRTARPAQQASEARKETSACRVPQERPEKKVSPVKTACVVATESKVPPDQKVRAVPLEQSAMMDRAESRDYEDRLALRARRDLQDQPEQTVRTSFVKVIKVRRAFAVAPAHLEVSVSRVNVDLRARRERLVRREALVQTESLETSAPPGWPVTPESMEGRATKASVDSV